jgi:hypothetical protein
MGICRDPIQISHLMASPAARSSGSERQFPAREYSPANPIRHFDPFGTSSHRSVSARPSRLGWQQAAAAECHALAVSDVSFGPTSPEADRRKSTLRVHCAPASAVTWTKRRTACRSATELQYVYSVPEQTDVPQPRKAAPVSGIWTRTISSRTCVASPSCRTSATLQFLCTGLRTFPRVVVAARGFVQAAERLAGHGGGPEAKGGDT